VPLYFAKERPMIERGEMLIPDYEENKDQYLEGEEPKMVMSRFRTLGCSPCTGAVRSDATNMDEIVIEAAASRRSERETRIIDGKEMVFMEPIKGDVSLIRAWKADTAGNLQYRMTENNFNQAAATASRLVIAEVEEIVPVGELDPNAIHTPGCYIDYLVKAHTSAEDLGTSASVSTSQKKPDDSRMAMARAG